MQYKRSVNQAHLLDLANHLHQHCGTAFLQLSRRHLSRRIPFSNVLQLLIVVQEKGKILEAHIHVAVSAPQPMQLDRVATTRESVLLYFVFDLRGGISKQNRGVGDARRHFRAGALKRGEEFGVDQGGFLVFELFGNVPSYPEIRVLVDSAGNQTRDVGFGSKDVRESVAKRRCGLDGGKVVFADIVRVDETKHGLCGRRVNLPRDFGDVFVECSAHVLVVGEDKGEFGVETAGDDVLGVFLCELHRVFRFQVFLEQEFFVVGHLDDDGNFESLLEPPGKPSRVSLNRAS